VRPLSNSSAEKYRIKPGKFYPLKGKTEVTITSRPVDGHLMFVVVVSMNAQLSTGSTIFGSVWKGGGEPHRANDLTWPDPV
jgi:hypothetical protein